jgi:hypothetical protein
MGIPVPLLLDEVKGKLIFEGLPLNLRKYRRNFNEIITKFLCVFNACGLRWN